MNGKRVSLRLGVLILLGLAACGGSTAPNLIPATAQAVTEALATGEASFNANPCGPECETVVVPVTVDITGLDGTATGEMWDMAAFEWPGSTWTTFVLFRYEGAKLRVIYALMPGSQLADTGFDIDVDTPLLIYLPDLNLPDPTAQQPQYVNDGTNSNAFTVGTRSTGTVTGSDCTLTFTGGALSVSMGEFPGSGTGTISFGPVNYKAYRTATTACP